LRITRSPVTQPKFVRFFVIVSDSLERFELNKVSEVVNVILVNGLCFV